MLHILWREYAGAAELTETLNSLSCLADDLLEVARVAAEASLAERFGAPIDGDGDRASLVVLAMGKLGGLELNFSSDIDVIFLYTADGETDGPRSLSAHEYFTRVSRRIVAFLEDKTEDGFAFRVDTRLRPFGDSGPPVVSFASLESYLIQHGRNWERYAYVKARVVGMDSDSPIVQDLARNLINPFVYRRYLDYGVFESLREMKSLIAAEVKKREMAENVKLGPGGIREIEFIVQSLQLVRGGRNENLRSRQLRKSLRELVRFEMLPEETARALLDAYSFLRRIENFIQAIRDQQTHDVPQGEFDRQRLALAMNFESWDSVEQQLDSHRATVSSIFQDVAFRSDGDERPTQRDADVAVALQSADSGSWIDLLTRRSIAEPSALAELLARFSGAAQVRNADSAARRRLVQFIPLFVDALDGRDNPVRTAQRLLTIIDKILRRSAYIALLNENPAVLGRLADLCSQSAYFADEIARYPLLLDEMLDPRLFKSVVSADDMRTDIATRIQQVSAGDSEQQVEILAQYQRAIMFRIAIADFSGALPVMKVSDSLTDLAEIVLARALAVAWRDLVQKHGEPRYTLGGERRCAGFGVIAYGKLGGMELSYDSDLDLVFLHDSQGTQQTTDGRKSLDNNLFFSRLVRRLVHFLTTQTPSGALYEIDTRLRPSGRSGLLVTSVEAFEQYQEDNAWTWEHQALLRSRPVAGSVGVKREFERVRNETLTNRVNRDSLATEVRNMREKMRRNLDQSNDTQFDLKQGVGGIGDIEFLVQYLSLKHASDNPAVIFYPDNIRQMGTLAAAGYLSEVDVSQLQEYYRMFRVRQHRLSLDGLPPLIDTSELSAQREFVGSVWERELN